MLAFSYWLLGMDAIDERTLEHSLFTGVVPAPAWWSVLPTGQRRSAAAVFNGRTGSYLVVGGGKRGEAALLVKGNLEIFTWIIIIGELASFLLEFETYAYSLLISRSIFLCLTSHDFSFSDRFSSHRSVSFSGWLKDPCPCCWWCWVGTASCSGSVLVCCLMSNGN